MQVVQPRINTGIDKDRRQKSTVFYNGRSEIIGLQNEKILDTTLLILLTQFCRYSSLT